MNPLATIEVLLEDLSTESIDQIIDFARALAVEDEWTAWHHFGLSQLAKAYGPDEPEYTEADLKPPRP